MTVSQSTISFPVWICGKVVKGFGRGSKELGIPTVNIEERVVQELCAHMTTGIYYGWARVNDDDDVYPMVMSLGWNPFYKNEKRSAEVHIMHKFDNDFYGARIQVSVMGYIREERDYQCVEDLIRDIHRDIEYASEQLKSPQCQKFNHAEIFNEYVADDSVVISSL